MSTPDFASMLKKPAGEAKKPTPFPGGLYPALIKSFEHVKAKTGTGGIQFNLVLQDWPEEVTEDEREGIDLSKRNQSRWTLYMKDEDQLWRLDELLRDVMKLDISGREYEELLPETIGVSVMADMIQGLDEKTNEPYSRVDKLLSAD